MSDEKLRKLCIYHGDALTERAQWCNGAAVLGALAEVESSFGVHNLPRHERAYDVSGRYFNKELWLKWGAWAACSYSSWQMMFPVAIEIGFTGRPNDLWDDEVAVHWVIEFITKRILEKRCTSLEQLADAYNSGSFKDANVPAAYIASFLKSYETIVDRRNLKKGV